MNTKQQKATTGKKIGKVGTNGRRKVEFHVQAPTKKKVFDRKRIELIVAILATPVVLTLLMTLAGCDNDNRVHFRSERDRSVRRREPVHTEHQPEYVMVREAPPPQIVERRPSPPSRGYIWIDGYWHWNGRGYVWRRGHWVRPPHERAAWIAPRYERHERGYRYTPGRWRQHHQERQRNDRHRDKH